MSASLRVVPSHSLRHRVAETLREAIAMGRFRMGDRLLERELCELTGVSRTCVREALRQLESEGLVTSIPNRGPIVTPIGIAEGRDIYDLRIVLEGLAAKLFATRATPQELDEIAATVAELDVIASAPEFDAQAFLAAKDRFYAQLRTGSRNEPLALQLRSLLMRMRQLRSAALTDPTRPRTCMVEVHAILAALRARDEEAAWSSCTMHVRRSAQAALAGLERAELDAVAQRRPAIGGGVSG